MKYMWELAQSMGIEVIHVDARESDMGVYGTSGTLDSRDIDADYDDDDYILCSNCDEEYTEDELSILSDDSIYQENVCDNCLRAYREKRKQLIDEIVNDYLKDQWNEGQIQP